jgi:hypothetical protein
MTPETRACANCDKPLTGEYCASCGQHAVDLNVPIRHFVAEFIRESFSLDSSLFRTLRSLLLKPGFLTQEYLAGRRARYVPPIRLYLVLSFSLFLLLAWTAPSGVEARDDGEGTGFEAAGGSIRITLSADSAGEGEGGNDSLPPAGEEAGWSQFVSERLDEAVQNPDRFIQTFIDRLAQVIFLLLPAFALLLKMLYRKRLYVHHLVFSVYFHAFTFAVMIVTTLIELAGWEVVSNILMLAVPAYLLLGMKRFYRQTWPRTVVKWGVLGATHMAVVWVTLAGALAATVLL